MVLLIFYSVKLQQTKCQQLFVSTKTSPSPPQIKQKQGEAFPLHFNGSAFFIPTKSKVIPDISTFSLHTPPRKSWENNRKIRIKRYHLLRTASREGPSVLFLCGCLRWKKPKQDKTIKQNMRVCRAEKLLFCF